MGCIDRTADFKLAVTKSAQTTPASSSNVHKRKAEHTDIPGGQEYVAEAYKIVCSTIVYYSSQPHVFSSLT